MIIEIGDNLLRAVPWLALGWVLVTAVQARPKEEKKEEKKKENMNATSGNDSEALQQMPIRAEENQGSKQVQKNRPHGRSAMSAAGED